MDKPIYTETVLFSGSTNGTVTLSDSVANYEYIENYYKNITVEFHINQPHFSNH